MTIHHALIDEINVKDGYKQFVIIVVRSYDWQYEKDRSWPIMRKWSSLQVAPTE